MTAVTDSDLKRLEDLIINGQKAIETRLTTLEVGQTEIKRKLKALELGQSEIKEEIKSVNMRIDGMSDRIKPIDKIPDLCEKVGEFKI